MAVILKEVNSVIDDQEFFGGWKVRNFKVLGKVLEDPCPGAWGKGAFVARLHDSVSLFGLGRTTIN